MAAAPWPAPRSGPRQAQTPRVARPAGTRLAAPAPALVPDGSWRPTGSTGTTGGPPPRPPTASPRRERDGDPALARDRREALLRVPPEQPRAGHAAGGADQQQRQHAEARRAEPVAHARTPGAPRRRSGPGKNAETCCAQSGRLSSGTATPPMISIGRKMHWPSACTAGTLSAIVAMTRPRPRNANDTHVKATNRSNGCRGAGMPMQHRERELDEAGGQQQQVARRDSARDDADGRHRRQAVPPPDAALALADHRRRQAEAGAAEDGDRQQLAHVP